MSTWAFCLLALNLAACTGAVKSGSEATCVRLINVVTEMRLADVGNWVTCCLSPGSTDSRQATVNPLPNISKARFSYSIDEMVTGGFRA